MAGRFSDRRLKGLKLGGRQYSPGIYAPASPKIQAQQEQTARNDEEGSLDFFLLVIFGNCFPLTSQSSSGGTS